MRAVLILLLALIPAGSVVAQLNKDLGDSSQVRGAHVTDQQVTLGLRQALAYGITDAVGLSGVKNGFWSNDVIKIWPPQNMRNLEEGLRAMGQGLKIEEFQLSMNRAAEDSAPAALPLFTKAIADLNPADARTILNGSKSAATDELKRSALSELARGLRPAADAAMAKYGVAENYNALVIHMKGLTFGQVAPFNIREYVVTQTLNGLFLLMDKDEEKMRADPASLPTPLLREVFTK
jgi:hypothetical protein